MIFTDDEILRVIDGMRKQEENNCSRFCANNAGNDEAIRDRKKAASVYANALSNLYYILVTNDNVKRG